MYRYIVGALAVAIIASVIGWRQYRQQQAAERRHQARIAELDSRIQKLENQNAQFKTELGMVQAEENRLVAENMALTKTLEQARLTGKVPNKLPYPPK